MFGAGAGVGLQRAETPGTRLQWGGDGSSITLIAISSAPDASGPALKRLLDSAFGAMVLVLGLDELVPIRNVERLKRDLRDTLDAFAAAAGTRWGCLVGAGRVRASTRRWGRCRAQSARCWRRCCCRGGGARGRPRPPRPHVTCPCTCPRAAPRSRTGSWCWGWWGGWRWRCSAGPAPPCST
ncbi:protein fuzzy homolog isoform X2 [Pezoporus wallicus]|uniref:protein fuzzy homolog isoform X2 n=1 Tax=Pezoporus wallicus TaxID=35540 RepID=UPI00254DA179|nr:protein fuzzy homolog isoform X2 [Pezoporus wallicus]